MFSIIFNISTYYYFSILQTLVGNQLLYSILKIQIPSICAENMKFTHKKVTKWLVAIFSEGISRLIKWWKKTHISYHSKNSFLLDLNIYLLGKFYMIVKLYEAKCLGELYNWEYLKLDLYLEINTDYILNSLKVIMQLRWRLYGTTIFFFPESASIEISTSCSTSLYIELGRGYS